MVVLVLTRIDTVVVEVMVMVRVLVDGMIILLVIVREKMAVSMAVKAIEVVRVMMLLVVKVVGSMTVTVFIGRVVKVQVAVLMLVAVMVMVVGTMGQQPGQAHILAASIGEEEKNKPRPRQSSHKIFMDPYTIVAGRYSLHDPSR